MSSSSRTVFAAALLALLLGAVPVTHNLAWGDESTPPSGMDEGDQQGPLGDLSDYGKLAEESLDAVGTGDFATARAKVDEMQGKWHAAAPQLKRKSPEDWKAANAAVEQVVKELHAKTPDKDRSLDALNTLLSTFNDIQGISD
ncbi:hypothetical protein ACA097_23615 [Pseudomonas sp. QL9]|uniref:Hypothetical secreted protein n=1 Tax=Pseudomonas knackmussii (strain DSM 6978 / CCUG 54928 / LMG 23759 / B13) TaxID=1301098 RepID=A0A024HII7_PSEKB|nr:hypothetical protein [Pseudomonas knackmussii]CDF84845.1 hypothetical secreted protein [Pseudomonas knackmussii B13]